MTSSRSAYIEWRQRRAEQSQRVRAGIAVSTPRTDVVYGGATSGVVVEKDEPVRSPAYRRLVASLNCMVCGATPCQAAHPNTGKGMGLKVDDRECFPLCPACHRRFDQGALFPKEARRELEPAWGRQTRHTLMVTGVVPPRLVAILKLQPDGSYAP